MKNEDMFLFGGAAVIGAMALIKNPSTGKTLLEDTAGNLTGGLAAGAGAAIGSAPPAFVGGIASGFAGGAADVGQNLATMEISLLPQPILDIQRWFFQQLPAFY